MKIKILVILLGSLLILQNCAAPIVKIAAVADSDQTLFNDSTVTSQKKHSVSISHYKNLELVKSNTLFQIAVDNRGEKALFINNDNISVIFKGNSEGWTSKKINIQPLDEFMKDLSDDYYYEEVRILANIIHKAQSAVMEVDEMDVDRVVNKVNKLRRALPRLRIVMPELILKPHYIEPYKSITGIVVCDTREMPEDLEGHFHVVLSIDGEDHEFTFSRSVINKDGSSVPVKRHSPHMR